MLNVLSLNKHWTLSVCYLLLIVVILLAMARNLLNNYCNQFSASNCSISILLHHQLLQFFSVLEAKGILPHKQSFSILSLHLSLISRSTGTSAATHLSNGPGFINRQSNRHIVLFKLILITGKKNSKTK